MLMINQQAGGRKYIFPGVLEDFWNAKRILNNDRYTTADNLGLKSFLNGMHVLPNTETRHTFPVRMQRCRSSV